MENTTVPEPTAAQIRASRRKIIFLFLMPVIAVGLSTLVYLTGFGIPKGTTNKGTLLQPPVNLDDARLQNAEGADWSYPSSAEWTLINFAPLDCTEACRERIWLSRQIHTALGRDATRVGRILLTPPGELEGGFAEYLGQEHQDLTVLSVDQNQLQNWLGLPDSLDPAADRLTMIADPNGFVMMRYAGDQPGADIIKDMRFLLKNSREKSD